MLNAIVFGMDKETLNRLNVEQVKVKKEREIKRYNMNLPGRETVKTEYREQNYSSLDADAYFPFVKGRCHF